MYRRIHIYVYRACSSSAGFTTATPLRASPLLSLLLSFLHVKAARPTDRPTDRPRATSASGGTSTNVHREGETDVDIEKAHFAVELGSARARKRHKLMAPELEEEEEVKEEAAAGSVYIDMNSSVHTLSECENVCVCI